MLFEHGQPPFYSGFCMKNPRKNISNAETVNSNRQVPQRLSKEMVLLKLEKSDKGTVPLTIQKGGAV